MARNVNKQMYALVENGRVINRKKYKQTFHPYIYHTLTGAKRRLRILKFQHPNAVIVTMNFAIDLKTTLVDSGQVKKSEFELLLEDDLIF